MGIDLHAKVIQERLGHSDVTLTIDTNDHVAHFTDGQGDTIRIAFKTKKTAQPSGSW